MNKITKKYRLCVLLPLVILLLAACSPKITYEEETLTVRGLLEFYDDPALFTVHAMTRYDISDEWIYYLVEWRYGSDYDQSYNYLAIYNRKTRLVSMAHLTDLEQGYFPDIRENWDAVRKHPTYTFSPEEISGILQNAFSLWQQETAEP